MSGLCSNQKEALSVNRECLRDMSDFSVKQFEFYSLFAECIYGKDTERAVRTYGKTKLSDLCGARSGSPQQTDGIVASVAG